MGTTELKIVPLKIFVEDNPPMDEAKGTNRAKSRELRATNSSANLIRVECLEFNFLDKTIIFHRLSISRIKSPYKGSKVFNILEKAGKMVFLSLV
jgi:hypothetical protein